MTATTSVYVHVPSTARTSAINAAAFSIDVTLPGSTLGLLFPNAAERRRFMLRALTAISSNTSRDDREALRDDLEHFLAADELLGDMLDDLSASSEATVPVAREAIDGVRVLPWAEIGPTLTCHEVEQLAALLVACGLEALAAVLLEGHTQSDEEGDRHYRPEAAR